MSKKDTIAHSAETPAGTHQHQITNNFNPSVNVNPTINVTTSAPVNVKTEQGKESGNSRSRGKSNALKRILIAVIIGVTVSSVGYFIRKSLSKGDGSHQEELHQPTENAIKTN